MKEFDVMETGTDDATVSKWAPVLEGIADDYTARVTAQLLENQAKEIVSERLNEDFPGNMDNATGTQSLGSFQKFAFPLVRRVFPELIANKICGVQPMSGPVSQIFYLGSNRRADGATQNLYSKYNLTYRGFETSAFGSGAFDLDTTPGDTDGNDANVSALVGLGTDGSPSGTYGGQIANFPDVGTRSTWGFSMSAGELLSGADIPEMTFQIEQQPVIARTRKLRALWTLEASQDLKAYHNLDLERELTDLLGKELRLEIDRELIEDLRMIAYNIGRDGHAYSWSNLNQTPESNNFVPTNVDDSQFGAFQSDATTVTDPQERDTAENVFFVDWASSALSLAPRHVGDVYANLLAALNLASQDIYKSTHRGPGNWILCAPVVASILESSSRLTGGIEKSDGPTNMGGNGVAHVGKFMGRYDLYVDPLYPEDEILMGYKGSSPMDAGFVYSPYIPLQSLPKVIDPETFQPRKGLLTRYGKAAITPSSRFYRVIRLVGSSNKLYGAFGTGAEVGGAPPGFA
jgi:hypothetical protein